MGRTFDSRVLQRALLSHYRWLERDDVGPRAVEAGECDRCGNEARLVDTCGPGPHVYLGRECALILGVDAWCDGHIADAKGALAWLAELPD